MTHKILSHLKHFVFLLLIPTLLSAADEHTLKTMMTEKADNLYAILKDKTLDKKTREQKVLGEVEHLFDFKLMSMLALDKQTWRSLSAQQRTQFSDLFIDHIKTSYLNKLDVFADTEVNVKSSDRIKKNRIYVTTILQSKTDEKEVIYKFWTKDAKEWFIYDVDVAGVSFLQSYRSQFASYLREHSFEDLLEELKKDDSSIKDK